MVSRFTFTLGHDPEWDAPCVNKVPHASGGFVRYSDYEALRAELEQVKRNNIGLHDEVQFMRNAAKENREAAQRLAGARVKALEWNEDWSGELDDIPVWHAMTPWGRVSVSFAGRGYKKHSDVPAYELQEKLAAAQADYERRILSALAEPAGEAEPSKWSIPGSTYAGATTPPAIAIREAAERIIWFDWSENDPDAVAAIDGLRAALAGSAE